MLWDISIWKIIVAIVAYFMVGGLWYSPALFAKPWMQALGKKKEDLDGGGAGMFFALLPLTLMVLTLAYLVSLTETVGAGAGLTLGLIVGLGFVAAQGVLNNFFQHGKWKLVAIDQGYAVVGLAVAGAILAS